MAHSKFFFDRELTKCAVLGIDMLLLLLFLGSSQNGILCTMQYTVNIYCFCTYITVHTCTCAPASTCTPVSTYTFCSDLVTFFHILLRSCNFFSHLHRTFCSLHRILPLFRTCKIFLTQIFKCPNKKKRVFTFCYFSTFVQNLFF